MGLENLIGVLFLASVHLWSGRLRFLDAKPRSPWLSVAGGGFPGLCVCSPLSRVDRSLGGMGRSLVCPDCGGYHHQHYQRRTSHRPDQPILAFVLGGYCLYSPSVIDFRDHQSYSCVSVGVKVSNEAIT